MFGSIYFIVGCWVGFALGILCCGISRLNWKFRQQHESVPHKQTALGNIFTITNQKRPDDGRLNLRALRGNDSPRFPS